MKRTSKKPRPKRASAGKMARLRKEEISLERRLEEEFSESVKSAGFYLRDSKLLRQLVGEAASKAASLPKQQFKETWAYLQTMLRLVRAYYRGEYKVPQTTLLLIVAVLVYLVNPLDLLPDWIPGLGLLDDAFIVALAVGKTRRTLEDFMVWETSRF